MGFGNPTTADRKRWAAERRELVARAERAEAERDELRGKLEAAEHHLRRHRDHHGCAE